MIKNPLSTIALFILISLLGSCNKTNNNTVSLEESILYEIFPDIIDSIYSDSRLREKPPSPFYIDSEGTKLELAPAEHSKLVQEWKDNTQKILNDPSPIYIVITDSIAKPDRYDSNELVANYSKLNLAVNSQKADSNKAFLIDLKSLKTNNKKIKFKHLSEFPEGRKFWKKEYDYYIAANITLSKILLDKTQNYGVLNVGYSKGALEGNGFKIFIKKDKNGKWVIDNIIGTWIA